MSQTEEQKKDVAETTEKTQWGLIIKDMLILMGIMGLIGYACNLLMKPFEKTSPTDSLVSIILKAGVKDGKDEVFSKELKSGIEKYENFVNMADQTGRTPLMWSVYANFNNPEEAIKKDRDRCFYVGELLKVPGIKPDMADKDGFTALHWAAWSGLPKCCEMLIKEGKLDVNAKESFGYTPLMLAALRGNSAVVEVLLKNGADPSLCNKDGKTAKDLAASSASAYACRGNWMYTLIYSEDRDKAYAATLKDLDAAKDAPAPAEKPAPAVAPAPAEETPAAEPQAEASPAEETQTEDAQAEESSDEQ